MKKVSIGILLLITVLQAFGQEKVIDSLSNLSYVDLDDYFYKSSIDSVNDIIYGKAYLIKAGRDQDDLRMANAYHFLSKASKSDIGIQYCDSIISLSEKLGKNEYYPTIAYHQKANIFFFQDNYEEALNNYLSALFYAKEGGSKLIELSVRRDIASLMFVTGDMKSALRESREFVDFINQSELEYKEVHLASSLYQLSNACFRNGIYDSTMISLNKGYPMALESQDTFLIAHYTLIYGANAYANGQYHVAIDSLESGRNMIENGAINLDEFNAFTNLYLGKSHFNLNNTELAIEYFSQVESHIQKSKSTEILFLEVYKSLIDHYKKEGDPVQQLKFVNNYLKADSLIQRKNSELENNIIYGFEISEILVERNQLIGRLEVKNERSQTINIILISVSVVILVSLIMMIRVNGVNKRKFKLIIQQLEVEKLSLKEQESSIVEPQPVKKNQVGKSDFPDEISNEILSKLSTFDKENQFLNSYTLPSLAKELKTNGTYLSRVINTYKSTNFSNYLNELRVKYVINRLDEDKRFRMYTIEAIAKESGYNTAQSFSKAFQKRTGLKPSYFINQLNNQRS